VLAAAPLQLRRKLTQAKLPFIPRSAPHVGAQDIVKMSDTGSRRGGDQEVPPAGPGGDPAAAAADRMAALERKFAEQNALIGQLAKQLALTTAATPGGQASPAPAEPSVVGLELDLTSPFAPLQATLYDFGNKDKVFRMLDYRPAAWTKDVYTASGEFTAPGEEVSFATAAAFYQLTVKNAIDDLTEAALNSEDEEASLSTYADALLELQASFNAIYEAQLMRTGYLHQKCLIPREDPEGRLANLRAKMLSSFRAFATTGSSALDKANVAFTSAVELEVAKAMAKLTAAQRVAGVRADSKRASDRPGASRPRAPNPEGAGSSGPHGGRGFAGRGGRNGGRGYGGRPPIEHSGATPGNA